MHIIPKQVNVMWGGISMVEATLELFYHALAGFNFDYYILISGVDYPIRSQSFLLQRLSEKKEFINIAKAPTVSKPLSRFEYFYFNFNRRSIVQRLFFGIMETFMIKMNIKRQSLDMDLYVGSQWFALTHDCVNYICTFLKDNPEYLKFFKHTLIPDESFFQTIIGNSQFASNTTQSLTYTDWDCPCPPAIISEKHIEVFKNNEEFDFGYGIGRPFFARKFDDNSVLLTNRIDKELRKIR